MYIHNLVQNSKILAVSRWNPRHANKETWKFLCFLDQKKCILEIPEMFFHLQKYQDFCYLDFLWIRFSRIPFKCNNTKLRTKGFNFIELIRRIIVCYVLKKTDWFFLRQAFLGEEITACVMTFITILKQNVKVISSLIKVILTFSNIKYYSIFWLLSWNLKPLEQQFTPN